MDSEATGVRPVYWEGAARLFDGREAKARETPVAIGPDGLEIRSGEAAGRYLRSDLEIIDQGAGDAFFTLSLKPHEGMVLAFQDPQAMEWLRSAGLVKRSPLHGLSWPAKVLILVALLTAFSGFMYLTGLDMMANGIVRLLPLKTDRMLGDLVVKGYTDSSKAPVDSLAKRALEKSQDLVRGLGPEAGDSIHIWVARDSSVKNAFAFPGGHIVVYSGMLRLLDSQEEWLALLAHEGGHIHLRHGMRQIVRSSLVAIIASLVFGDVSGLGSTVLDNAGTLANLNYSRRDEGEADAFARRSLSEDGHPASGLVTLFEKLLKLQSLPGWATFLSTHPATEDRIARLKGVPPGPKASLLTPEEWAALRKM